MRVIKRVWPDGGYFYQILDCAPDEMAAIQTTGNANQWIEDGNAEIAETLPAVADKLR